MKKYNSLLVCIIIIFATLCAYWQVYLNDFVVFDDSRYVVNNKYIQDGLSFKGTIWAFTSIYASNWHPLTWISHMLDIQLFGLNPATHHLTSLLLHIVNSLLLFLVFKRMTGTIWQSASVALLFALHPLHVESVAWVAERKDVLSTFFWIVTMMAYARYADNPSIRKYLLVLIFFIMGLLSKPMLVTLPFVLLLLDYWPLRRLCLVPSCTDLRIAGIQISRLLWEKVPFIAVAAAASVITYVAQSKGGTIHALGSHSFLLNASNAAIAYVSYITKMFCPSNLAVFYPVDFNILTIWPVTGAIVFLVFVFVLVIWVRQRYPYLVVGWFWYVGTLVPVIGLVHVGAQSMADRYTYIPLIGLFVMITWAVSDYTATLRQKHKKVIIVLVALPIFLTFAVLTSLQVRYWRNEFTLFKHAVEVTENNALAHNNVGTALIDQGDFKEAYIHISEALRIKPDYSEAYNNLGVIYGNIGDTVKAIEAFKESIRHDPYYAIAHFNLGRAYHNLGYKELTMASYQILKNIDVEYADKLLNLITN